MRTVHINAHTNSINRTATTHTNAHGNEREETQPGLACLFMCGYTHGRGRLLLYVLLFALSVVFSAPAFTPDSQGSRAWLRRRTLLHFMHTFTISANRYNCLLFRLFSRLSRFKMRARVAYAKTTFRALRRKRKKRRRTRRRSDSCPCFFC